MMNLNLASHSNLCHIISPLTNTKDIARLKDQIARSEVSWERVVHRANTHLIISAVWVGLCEKKLDSKLENEVRNYLQKLHTLNLRRNQGLKRQAIEAVDVLNKIGIVPMLIKGAVQLFQPVHKDFGARMMTDLDILVPKSRIDEAIKALTQIGYQIHYDPNIDWEAHYHVAPMGRQKEYGCIELHHGAYGKYANQVLSTAEIWATAKECVTTGIRFKVPNTTCSVLLGLLHSQFTHGYPRRLMLDYKGLLDMVAMVGHLNRDVDWNQIQNRLAKHGLKQALRTHLWMAHRMFNLPVQNDIRPNAYTRLYHGLFMAKIRWDTADRCFEKYFNFEKNLRKHTGPFKQLFPFRLVFRKTNLEVFSDME